MPSTRSKQPNQRSSQKSGSSCYGLSYHQIIKCSDYQKRLQSGSGCYGFSDYHHLDRVSPIHHTAGTTLTPGFSMQHIFCTELQTFFFSKMEPSLGNEIILTFGFDCKTIDNHHLCTSKVPSLIISFSVQCTSLAKSVLVLD